MRRVCGAAPGREHLAHAPVLPENAAVPHPYHTDPMLGLFNLFGRSPDLKALDHALREAGLHPGVVPEAVKLTVVRLLKQACGGTPPEAAYREAALLLGYCIQGRDEFAASSSVEAPEHVERRLEEAIAAGDGLDAKLVLLTLHSGVIAPEVVDRFELETG